MALAELCVEDLRCIEKAELSLGPGTHLIFGPNGAGKTSLLEAAFLLGRGRSFRTRQNERLIRHGQALLRVVGRTEADPIPHTLGVEVAKERGTRARVDAANVRSLADLTAVFPVQALDPDAHKLIEEAAARRRRWLDWAVFHVEPSFAESWSRYSRALQQRNAALRSGIGEVEVWDPELAREGEAITEARYRVLAALKPYWTSLVEELVGVEVTLGFNAGWDRSEGLALTLAAGVIRDRERRTTVSGPHRADVLLRVRGRAAREVLSRGQQKLAAVAMTLCQLEYLRDEHGLRPTLLLDDPSAELDQERLARFIARVRALDAQLIITALERDYRLFGEPQSMFHVEQGRVTRV